MNSVQPMEKESQLMFRDAYRKKTMRAYKPVPTVLSTVIVFLLLGTSFITVGVVVYTHSMDITQAKARYDNVGDCVDTVGGETKSCIVTIEITEDISDTTVYLYYELHNYYQNHRRYVRSKSFDQLSGEDLPKEELDDCEPILTYDDLGFYSDQIPSGVSNDTVAYPCGLIAQSFFNDTFSIVSLTGQTIAIDNTNIAWEFDKEKKFKRISGKEAWQDVTDEHFIVWMRVSGLRNFRKLWGRIDEGLSKGTYIIAIKSNYDVSDFDGKKYVVLSTANSLGGKNDFLGIAFIVIGILTIVLALFFAIKGYFFRKPIINNP